MAKGLSGIFARAVELQVLSGIKMGAYGLVISHPQYADDTIILAKATVDNIWSIKAILHGFELALGLMVKFAFLSLG